MVKFIIAANASRIHKHGLEWAHAARVMKKKIKEEEKKGGAHVLPQAGSS
jgi:hypothetical protein